MKKLAYLFFLAIATIVYSCGGEITKTENKEPAAKETASKEKTPDCEQYVHDYQVFIDNYIDAIYNLTEAPDDDLKKAEVNKFDNDMPEWEKKWKEAKCSDNDNYRKKYEEITDNLVEAKAEIQ